jgi:two-component system, chemotaxis family, chemotaxis protein CheY
VRALIVDDSQAMRVILSRMLSEQGYDVFQAQNGLEAIEYLKAQGTPEVVLVDWNMPEMNGLDFVRAVRQELRERDVLLMMVTTETETAQMVKALAAGANEYLMKPFTKDALMEKLELLGVGPQGCGKSAS